MGLFHSLQGAVYIKIISADISRLLSQISDANITVAYLRSIDEMTVEASVLRKDYNKLIRLTQHRGDKLILLKKQGAYWRTKQLSGRPVLITGFVIMLLIALLLPTRILFVQVKGNNIIPSKLIIETADSCGISIFASRRKVRSEKVKNALLERIPELQWIGVNTAGCVATINVTEKTVNEQTENDENLISSIVASRDGVICDFTVLQGNQLCQIGQAVKAGQVLISGYTDCGISIKATRAQGEIYARTFRDLQVISPVITDERVLYEHQKTNYSLIIGKKLIKFYKDSGISDVSCVRIYEEMKLTLPGGYQLPISLVRETITDCQYSTKQQSGEFEWLTNTATNYLQNQMIAGKILEQSIRTELLDDLYLLNGQFACLEMIGQIKEEEIIQR